MCCECGIVAFANAIIVACVGFIALDLAEMLIDPTNLEFKYFWHPLLIIFELQFLLGVPLCMYRLRGRLAGEAGIVKKLMICWALLAIPVVLDGFNSPTGSISVVQMLVVMLYRAPPPACSGADR